MQSLERSGMGADPQLEYLGSVLDRVRGGALFDRSLLATQDRSSALSIKQVALKCLQELSHLLAHEQRSPFSFKTYLGVRAQFILFINHYQLADSLNERVLRVFLDYNNRSEAFEQMRLLDVKQMPRPLLSPTHKEFLESFLALQEGELGAFKRERASAEFTYLRGIFHRQFRLSGVEISSASIDMQRFWRRKFSYSLTPELGGPLEAKDLSITLRICSFLRACPEGFGDLYTAEGQKEETRRRSLVRGHVVELLSLQERYPAGRGFFEQLILLQKRECDLHFGRYFQGLDQLKMDRDLDGFDDVSAEGKLEDYLQIFKEDLPLYRKLFDLRRRLVQEGYFNEGLGFTEENLNLLIERQEKWRSLLDRFLSDLKRAFPLQKERYTQIYQTLYPTAFAKGEGMITSRFYLIYDLGNEGKVARKFHLPHPKKFLPLDKEEGGYRNWIEGGRG